MKRISRMITINKSPRHIAMEEIDSEIKEVQTNGKLCITLKERGIEEKGEDIIGYSM